MKMGSGDLRLPVSEAAADRILSLPVFPEITDDEIDYVTDCIKEVI